jgi:hypothetical protein
MSSRGDAGGADSVPGPLPGRIGRGARDLRPHAAAPSRPHVGQLHARDLQRLARASRHRRWFVGSSRLLAPGANAASNQEVGNEANGH